MQRLLLMWLLMFLWALPSARAAAALPPSVATVQEACRAHAHCRLLFASTKEGHINDARFNRLATLYLNDSRVANALLPRDLDDPNVALGVATLMLAQLTLNRADKCPPNHVLVWNDERTVWECTCQLDRDCSEEARRLSHRKPDAFIIVLTAALVLATIVLIVIRISHGPFAAVRRQQ